MATSFKIYHTTFVNSKLKDLTNPPKYDVSDGSGTLVVTGGAMTYEGSANRGVAVATVDPTGWADGEYWIQMFDNNKRGVKHACTFAYVAIANESPVGLAFSGDITAIKAVTDLIPDAGAMTSIAQEATLGTPIDTDLATDINNVYTDMAKDATVAKEATTAKESTLVTVKTDTSTILNRIGAFAGSGINTILGFFKAVARDDATAPSDMGGTYDPNAHALEAIRKRGDTSWGAAGTNEYTLACGIVTSGTVRRFSAATYKNGMFVKTATNLTLTVTARNPTGGPDVEDTIVISAPSADGFFDAELPFEPVGGALYAVEGTVEVDGGAKQVASFFWAVSA